MNLKKIRKDRGYTQKEIAEYLNVAQNTYSYWENDKYRIDKNSLKKLAKFYNVTTDYLLGITNLEDRVSIPDDIKNIQFAFNNFDFSGLTEENIEDLKAVAKTMRKRNMNSKDTEEKH